MTVKKRRILSNFDADGGGLDLPSLRNLAKNHPGEFSARAADLIAKGEFSWSDVRDLKGFYNAFADIPVEVRVQLHGQTRAVTSSAFPVLSGNLTVAGINAAYDAVPVIGDQLVTDFDSAKETAVIVGLLAESHSNLERKEGQEYPLVGAGEERFDIGSNGKGLRMQITQEMIERNDMENVVARVSYLGEVPAEEIEEQTLKRIYDYNGSKATPEAPYALTINKTGTALYQTDRDPLTRLPSTGNRITTNALVDSTDLEAARLRLTQMTNSRGKRINIPVSSTILLVPEALAPVAQTILGSQLTPGVFGEQNPWGPQGSYRPRLLASSKLDALSTTAWHLGDFKRQFRRKWGIRMEMVTLSGDVTNYLRNRIAFEARVGWDCETAAVDYVYCIQSLSGTTTPGD